MGRFGRYGPLVGGVILAGSAILRAFGQGALADTIEALAAILGVTAGAIISIGEATILGSAAVVMWGAWRKYRAIRNS